MSSSLDRRGKFSLAGVLLLTLVTFCSTFRFGWVYDDPPQIPQNPDLQWRRVGYLFTHHLWASSPDSVARFYRPLLSFWFLVNKTLFGLNPHWFHVTTVLAHVGATVLVFMIARELLENTGAALLATAIFGLHPLQVEPASWISAVNDPLAALFCFASFLARRKASEAQHGAALWWALSAGSFFLALLSKETSVMLPAVVLVDIWAYSRNTNAHGHSSRIAAITIGIYGLAAVPWFLLRRYALGQAAITQSFVGRETAWLTVPKLILFDLCHAVLPIRLGAHYDFRLIDSPIGMPFVLTLGALVILAWSVRFVTKRHRQLATAFAWITLPLLPSLNLRWMNEDSFLHDRYMYMSMLGLALLAGFAYSRLQLVLPAVSLRYLCVALIAGMAFTSAVQSQYWANDLSVFRRAVQIAPNNEWSHLSYGSALSSRGTYSEAAAEFVKSYELKPGWRAAGFAGFAFERSGDLSQSERWLTTALRWNPQLADAWFVLAQLRLEQHNPRAAIEFLSTAQTIRPNAPGYHYVMGMALEQISQPAEALLEYRAELQAYPGQTPVQKAIERLQKSNLKEK